MKRRELLKGAVALPAAAGSAVAAGRVPDSGVYSKGVRPEQADVYLGQPYICGGQILLQWRDVEPVRGRYDFSSLDHRLSDFAQRRQRATIQINGNFKPVWLFGIVPSTPEKQTVQVYDDEGTLMYWHPAHRESYLAMLAALGRHLSKSPCRDSVLGIRMNLNAIGTEFHRVAPEFLPLERWKTPPGVSRQGLVVWSQQIDDAYVKAVVEAHISAFKGVIRIFVRNSIAESILAPYQHDFENGTLSWFHTSSEAEPRSGRAEIQYQRFYEYCRSGKTTGYTEPWASAWGDHLKVDDRWCSPPQWNYWRLLFDLHCGVSFIALYTSDMRMAIEGVYKSGKHEHVDRDGSFKSEFNAAHEFAARYAGYHAAPECSPGAWVAFRENHIVRAANGMTEAERKLRIFTGDYNFLAERLPGDKSAGLDVVNIGPDNQRFGAWARVLPAGESMRIRLDRRFVSSLTRGGVARLTYLDAVHGSIQLKGGGSTVHRDLQGSGRWQILSVPLKTPRPAPDLEISVGAAPVHLHMLEVVRS
jgi:hypothetical protein